MNECDVCWLAGLIDGEGWIGVSEESSWTFRRLLSRIGVSNTDFEILEKCKKISGVGNIHKDKEEGRYGNSRAQKRWQVFSWDECYKLAGMIWDKMKGNKRTAAIMMMDAYLSYESGNYEENQIIYETFRCINRTGIDGFIDLDKIDDESTWRVKR